ncbi:glutamate carboxypeptidase [Histoplasma capsulatum H143]|uniref:Glutamate carboxypeptidase n=1 Tax=Ajellomyces capsulatus (strain H143) TaxID=544712 RepID=C6HP83_AJECH|nr:glutamate carboxypeptidase [Histoplasma capsulatum H143]
MLPASLPLRRIAASLPAIKHSTAHLIIPPLLHAPRYFSAHRFFSFSSPSSSFSTFVTTRSSSCRTVNGQQPASLTARIHKSAFYANIDDSKMAPQLEPFFKEVDNLQDHFIDRLRKAVAIPSISAQDDNRRDVVRMGEFLVDELKRLGAEVEIRQLGKEPGRPHLDLPPVILTRYGNDKNKRTILVYGHYDVQPALREDGWNTEPFTLTVDEKGRMFGINELVAPLTEDEKNLYTDIGFTMDNLYESLGNTTSIFPDKESTLMRRWRYPSLSVHGVEGAYSAPGAKTVIPAKVIGKFSIRTVPNMESDDVDRLVFDYVKAEFAKLNSKNTMDCSLQHGGKWWVASPKHWNFQAASKAVKQVFGMEPDMTREGGSIPITLTFEEATGKNVLLLPMGSSTDMAHSTNEKLDKRNYIEGTKLMGAYLHYVAEEPVNE